MFKHINHISVLHFPDFNTSLVVMATAGSLLQWQSTAPMPTKRVFATSVVHKNFLYIIGGCDVSGVPLDAMEMYDGHKKWKRLMSMPTRRAGTAAVVVEDKIISMAGVAESQEPLDAVEIFDTNARTWSVVEPLGEALLGISAVTRGEGAEIIMH